MTNAAASPALSDLVLRGDTDELERNWNESMGNPGPVSEYVPTLQILVETGRREFAAAAASKLVKVLVEKGRAEDAIGVMTRLATWKVDSVKGLESVTMSALESAYGKADWFDYVLGKAGVTRGEDVSWDKFSGGLAVCLGFLPGRIVEHGSGWGAGRIEELLPDTDEVTIAFESGRNHTVPWQTAMDTMNALPDEDLRAMRFHLEQDVLFDFAKAAPTELLRRALRIYRGKANSTQIKEQLHERVVPAKSWTGWWKKAKAAAVEDPLIAVEGSASRPTLTLRKKALTLTDEARAQLKFEKSASSIVRGLRAYFDRATRDSDREQLSEYARERLAGIAMNAEGVESAHAILFLEEIGQLPVEEAAPMIRPILGIPHDGDFDSRQVELEILTEIEDSAIRSRLAEQLPLVLGDKWVDVALEKLPTISEMGECEDALEILVDKLCEAKVPTQLVELYEKVAPFPTKHPFLIYMLTKAHGEGAFDGAEKALDPNVVCRVILHALRVVCEQHTGRRHTRLQSRIQTLLSGRKGVLADLLDKIDRHTMTSALNSARAGGEDFPAKVQVMLDNVARRRFPDFFQEIELMFWEDDYDIYVTKQGFEHREKEFHHLRDELIPANSKAIGEAASLGDLSENAEWEAAIEEQRNLTAKASEWEDELSRTRFIEEADVPDNVVAPGTEVEVEDVATGTKKSMRILGPWDSVLGEDVVSYKAPLAQGLLGTAKDDEAEITLPNGKIRLRVVAIRKIF